MVSNQFVKYCPACDAENTRTAAFCCECKNALSNTPVVQCRESLPAPSTPESRSEYVRSNAEGTKRVKGAVCVLELLENPRVKFFVYDGQTVGRTNAADVVLHGVPHSDYISSCHAKFFRRGTQWYVQHIGSTNFIRVEDEEYDDDTEVGLDHNAMLTLSLTTFTVKLDGQA